MNPPVSPRVMRRGKNLTNYTTNFLINQFNSDNYSVRGTANRFLTKPWERLKNLDYSEDIF